MKIKNRKNAYFLKRPFENVSSQLITVGGMAVDGHNVWMLNFTGRRVPNVRRFRDERDNSENGVWRLKERRDVTVRNYQQRNRYEFPETRRPLRDLNKTCRRLDAADNICGVFFYRVALWYYMRKTVPTVSINDTVYVRRRYDIRRYIYPSVNTCTRLTRK